MRILLLLFGLCMGTSVMAQENGTTELRWLTDFEGAKAVAAERDASILLVFAGSDWCRPCIQLKQNVLDHPAFAEAVSDELVVLYLDFPAKKKNQLDEATVRHHEALAERYNRLGAFPKLVLINADEELLAEPEYKGEDVEGFLDLLTDRD